MRRRSRFDAALAGLAERLDAGTDDAAGSDDEDVEDDQVRLIFTCCHPDLPPDARVALTLREVCGLTTEEIARAFLTAPSTLAQRIVRAKAKIRDAGIPFEAPSPDDLPDRLDPVLQVIYLVFNEGYSASSGASLTRPDLSGEAIRLGRLLIELLPEAEVAGLLALMLLQESRRAPRRQETWLRWRTRTARCGTGIRSRKGRRWWNRRYPRAGSAITRSRRRSRRCTARRPPSQRRTGLRSSGFMTCWRRRSRHLWSS